MSRKLPIFYSALLLTGANLLLRFAATAFQVFLSGRIGAEGIGLLQLVMSVGSLATVAGMAGIRTTGMYLAAAQRGKNAPHKLPCVLSGCIRYSICTGGCVAFVLYGAAPLIAEYWICIPDAAQALRLYALFLPVSCMAGATVGYYTGINRIGTLATVEIAEQCIAMLCTFAFLRLFAGTDALRCCLAVILGNGIAACLSLLCLCMMQLRRRKITDTPLHSRQLLDTALPLALADNLKAGISTAENLIVPRRLALYAGTASPLGAFGTLIGMVFPVLMFPSCILFGLTELLIPELARCAAAGSHARIRYLTRRSLRLALWYGCLVGGLEYLLAGWLCQRLYPGTQAGAYLRLYALLIPMLYLDAIVDAMTKGLGQQKICVRYNILTSAMDVALLYLVLPAWGMDGYFFSFLVTHLINFILSLRRLLRISAMRPSVLQAMRFPAAAIWSVWLASFAAQPLLRALAYPLILAAFLYLSGAFRREDLRWLQRLVQIRS